MPINPQATLAVAANDIINYHGASNQVLSVVHSVVNGQHSYATTINQVAPKVITLTPSNCVLSSKSGAISTWSHCDKN